MKQDLPKKSRCQTLARLFAGGSNKSICAYMLPFPFVPATETLCSMSMMAEGTHSISAPPLQIWTFPASPLHPWVMAVHQGYYDWSQ